MKFLFCLQLLKVYFSCILSISIKPPVLWISQRTFQQTGTINTDCHPLSIPFGLYSDFNADSEEWEEDSLNLSFQFQKIIINQRYSNSFRHKTYPDICKLTSSLFSQFAYNIQIDLTKDNSIIIQEEFPIEFDQNYIE